MGKAQRQIELLALRLGAIADADQLKLALKALRNAFDHVGEQGTGSARNGPRTSSGLRGTDIGLTIGNVQLNISAERQMQLTLRTLDLDRACRLVISTPWAAEQAFLRLWTSSSSRICIQPASGNDAEHFSAMPASAGRTVAHHTSRR